MGEEKLRRILDEETSEEMIQESRERAKTFLSSNISSVRNIQVLNNFPAYWNYKELRGVKKKAFKYVTKLYDDLDNGLEIKTSEGANIYFSKVKETLEDIRSDLKNIKPDERRLDRKLKNISKSIKTRKPDVIWLNTPSRVLGEYNEPGLRSYVKGEIKSSRILLSSVKGAAFTDKFIARSVRFNSNIREFSKKFYEELADRKEEINELNDKVLNYMTIHGNLVRLAKKKESPKVRMKMDGEWKKKKLYEL